MICRTYLHPKLTLTIFKVKKHCYRGNVNFDCNFNRLMIETLQYNINCCPVLYCCFRLDKLVERATSFDVILRHLELEKNPGECIGCVFLSNLSYTLYMIML